MFTRAWFKRPCSFFNSTLNYNESNRKFKLPELTGKFLHAFTLSELLMSVLVISVVMVAMAPVITKRVNDNLHITGSGGGGGAKKQVGVLFTLNTTGQSSAYDISCANSGLYNTCDFKIPRGAKNINAVIVSGGGGGGGAARPKTENKYMRGGTGSAATFKIENYMRNFRSDFFMSAGGAGGGAAYKIVTKNPSSQTDCDQYNAVYLKTDTTNNTGICMLKYNVGDTLGPTVDTLVLNPVNFTPTESGSINGCWGNDYTAASYNYSKFSKMVLCENFTAEKICFNHKVNSDDEVWTLPTSDELTAAASQMVSKASTLNLCSSSTSKSYYCTPKTGTNYCSYAYYGPSSTSNKNGCCPSCLLTSNGASYDWGSSGFASLTDAQRKTKYAGSGRCVLREIVNSVTGAGGGGGSGGNGALITKIPNDVIEKSIGGTIYLGGAASQAGGAAATANNSKGGDGFMDPLWSDANTSDMMKIYNSEYAQIGGLEDALENGTLAEKYKHFSYMIITSAAGDVNFIVRLINGYPGTAGDCSRDTCYPGEGGSISANLYSKLMDYASICEFRDTETTYSRDCSESSYIKAMPGLDGQDGKYYSSMRELFNNNDNYNVNYGSGNAGIGGAVFDGRYDSYNGWIGYGQGGKGGNLIYYFDKSTSSMNIKAQSGNDTSGLTDLDYTNYYPVSGGSGGASGHMLRINNYPVEAGKTMKIYVGNGGAGAQKPYQYSSNAYSGYGGSAGYQSGIEYDGKKAIVNGGGGGYGGSYQTTSFTTATAQTTVGAVGATNITIPANYYELIQGNAGSPSIVLTDSSGNFTSSPGGMGGKSPTGSYGGCGGIFSYSTSLPTSVKNHVNTNKKCANTESVGAKEQIIIPTDFINTQDFGQAGAGGGGGGWSFNKYDDPGAGGDGQPGYVYIWWTVEE